MKPLDISKTKEYRITWLPGKRIGIQYPIFHLVCGRLEYVVEGNIANYEHISTQLKYSQVKLLTSD